MSGLGREAALGRLLLFSGIANLGDDAPPRRLRTRVQVFFLGAFRLPAHRLRDRPSDGVDDRARQSVAGSTGKQIEVDIALQKEEAPGIVTPGEPGSRSLTGDDRVSRDRDPGRTKGTQPHW